MHCTRHRVFLATLIVAAKYLNDSSPKNKHWTKYGALFSQAEVNLMEKQLLYLLDYDLRMEEDELLIHFSPFFRRSEDRAEAGRREMNLRGCEAGRERERYARASERRIALRNLPASEVPCYNTSDDREHHAQPVICKQPSMMRPPCNAPPSPVSPSPKARSSSSYRSSTGHGAMMARQQSSESSSSSVASSEADLTDDNGSSSSSAEEYDDYEEYYDDEGLDETHHRMQQLAQSKDVAPEINQSHYVDPRAQAVSLPIEEVENAKVGTAMHRYIASALPASLRKSAGGEMPTSGSMRSVRSSSNLLARMLGHQSAAY